MAHHTRKPMFLVSSCRYLPNPLKPVVNILVENEFIIGAVPTDNAAPTTSVWSTMLLPTKVRLILEDWRYFVVTYTLCTLLQYTRYVWKWLIVTFSWCGFFKVPPTRRKNRKLKCDHLWKYDTVLKEHLGMWTNVVYNGIDMMHPSNLIFTD